VVSDRFSARIISYLYPIPFCQRPLSCRNERAPSIHCRAETNALRPSIVVSKRTRSVHPLSCAEANAQIELKFIHTHTYTHTHTRNAHSSSSLSSGDRTCRSRFSKLPRWRDDGPRVQVFAIRTRRLLWAIFVLSGEKRSIHGAAFAQYFVRIWKRATQRPTKQQLRVEARIRLRHRPTAEMLVVWHSGKNTNFTGSPGMRLLVHILDEKN